jgi:hypothetical protein
MALDQTIISDDSSIIIISNISTIDDRRNDMMSTVMDGKPSLVTNVELVLASLISHMVTDRGVAIAINRDVTHSPSMISAPIYIID